MALISRDPFAREEIHRSKPLSARDCGFETTCVWCGGLSASKKLFRYWTETDGGTKHVHKGLFCSKSCHDSYHH